MPDDQPNRFIPAHAEIFRFPLRHFSAWLGGAGPIKIVALGSSSTAGEGGIVPYTYRLQDALRAKYDGRTIDVLNRGKGGDEAPGELARMRDDVLAEDPTLVIWQVGTNAVWQPGHDLAEVTEAIRKGVALLDPTRRDVVLMDLQYAPALLTDDKIAATRKMLGAIADVANSADVNLFRRFDFMRQWHEVEGVSFDRIIDPTDATRLHQSDWSARRIGYELAEMIGAAATAVSS
jgi:lysophospholipase L1-like esterase